LTDDVCIRLDLISQRDPLDEQTDGQKEMANQDRAVSESTL